jgi:hypothetical protein
VLKWAVGMSSNSRTGSSIRRTARRLSMAARWKPKASSI